MDSYSMQQSSSTHPLSSPLDSIPSLPFPLAASFDPSDLSQIGGHSPLKQLAHLSSPPPADISALAENSGTILPPPQASAFITDSPLKRPPPPMYHPIVPMMPSQSSLNAFSSSRSAGKENERTSFINDNFAEFPDPSFAYPNLPGQLPGEIPLPRNGPLDKIRTDEPQAIHIPEPHEMPPVEDEGGKPSYSYAAMIGMAILRAPNRRLTLAQIYKWISDTFAYYDVSDSGNGWQNSIRHNLSLNKAFGKRNRPKDDPGKGSYWVIEPGMEAQFVKEKPCRRPASSSGLNAKTLSQPPRDMSVLTSSMPTPVEMDTKNPEAEEPSSDATIPVSDPVEVEPDRNSNDMPPPGPSSRAGLSSPLQALRSSPPIRHRSVSRDTSPSPAHAMPSHAMPSSSLGTRRSRKRKFGSMNDSGYYSSLESSALRRSQNGLKDLSGSVKPDMAPRFKVGRAEEEIARIRSSSHDISPVKTRTKPNKHPLSKPSKNSKCNDYNTLLSSSPLRPSIHLDNPLMLPPPLTPVTKFKRPAPVGAQISPNTNLRNHRNKVRALVGSPFKTPGRFLSDGVEENTLLFSPAFNIGDDDGLPSSDSPSEHDDTSFLSAAGFTIFTDDIPDLPGLSSPAHGYGISPLKRRTDSARGSAKRPRLERASTASGILADVTGARLNASTSSGERGSQTLLPTLKAPFLESPCNFNGLFQSSSPNRSPPSFDLAGTSFSPMKNGFPAGSSPAKGLRLGLSPLDGKFVYTPRSKKLNVGINLGLDMALSPRRGGVAQGGAVGWKRFEKENLTIGGVQNETNGFLAFDMFADQGGNGEEEDGFGEGFDILQGFRGIGQKERAPLGALGNGRPGLGGRRGTTGF